MNILLGVTGSVAAVLTPKLIKELQTLGEVRPILTLKSYDFLDEQEITVKIYDDFTEDQMFSKIGDPILHIELRKWADILVIAPCTMNTLAKISNGLCDNLLTNLVRAWDYQKPFLIAPACNTHMWNSKITYGQVLTMQEMGARFIPPISKTLACGDTGVGAMAPILDIYKCVSLKHSPCLGYENFI